MSSIEAIFREETRRVVASLVRRGGTIEQAEDALQEAFLVAIETWPRDGVPTKPGAWIATTSQRRLIDRLRRESRRADKELLSDLTRVLDERDEGDDDRLRLIFTCCHPALNLDVRVALTLRACCGLSTADVARLFLVSESTMAQRLVRAQRKIAVARIPFAVPTGDDLAPRVDAVLGVVYSMFTAGYDAAGRDDAATADFCAEAIRLGRLLHLLLPTEAEVIGLLALMLLHDARRSSRRGGDATVLFEDQDRARWNQTQLREGGALIGRAAHVGPVGQYWLQAAIAAEHALPATAKERDWHRIASLYHLLIDQTGGASLARLNHAIAVSFAVGPEPALELLDGIDDLATYSPYHGARAGMLARLAEVDEARAAYQWAIDTSDDPRRRRSLFDAIEKLC